MKPKSTRIGISNRPVLEIEPSHEAGIFVTPGKWYVPAHVGRTAIIYDISPEDIVAIELGTSGALAKYLPVDPEEAGVFHLNNCTGSLQIEEGGTFPLTAGIIREFTPFTVGLWHSMYK